jgi:AraC family transcriptional activator of pobA
MRPKDKIVSLDLLYKGSPSQFVLKSMEEIDMAMMGLEAYPHRHNYFTIIWPFTATGKHIIDFREYPLMENNIFFVSPWQVHQVIMDPAPTGYIILFTNEFLDRNSIRNDFIANLKLFKNIDDTPPLPVDVNMALRLRTFAESIRSAFNSRDEMYLETIGAYLKLFLIECNGHCTLVPDSNTQSAEVSKNLVRNFKELVEKNHSRWHQVKEYAESLSVTPNYLNEVIRSSVNIPAKEFIQHRIILEAKRMVIYSEKSSKEIGFDLGFNDPAHFSKFFRNNTGQSLAGFRESLSL